MTTGLRFFYRHIHVTGLHNIPANGPAIIIANHNSSLMDAALLGVLLKRKVWFFARGDVFINKPIQKILWWLHMVPVHSYAGGRNTLNANNDSFSDGQQILLNGGIIVFFPESSSHTEHQLLPFRKGVFRLAFDTARARNFTFNIPIVPVGISYDHPVECRTAVQVYLGAPLLLSAYQQAYNLNPATALLQVCRDAHLSVSKMVLHIADRRRLQTAEQHLTINRNNNPVKGAGWKIGSAVKLDREMAVCKAVNSATDYEFNDMQQQSDNYFDALAAGGVKDNTVSGNAPFLAWKKIMLWIGFPVYLLGLLLNGLPVLVARAIADRKVYRKDFYSWIFVAGYCFMYLLWLLAVEITFFFIGWQYAMAIGVLMAISGLFAYQYKGWLIENNQQRKWQALSAATVTQLKAMRSGIQLPVWCLALLFFYQQ